MSKLNRRRDFISKAGSAIAAAGLGSQAALNAAPAETAPHTAAGEDYYDKLGVTKIINATVDAVPK